MKDKPKTISLRALAEEMGTSLRYNWRELFDDYTCNLERVEIMEDGLLCSTFGEGKTKAAARRDYAAKLCRQRIVFRAYYPDRKERQLGEVRA